MIPKIRRGKIHWIVSVQCHHTPRIIRWCRPVTLQTQTTTSQLYYVWLHHWLLPLSCHAARMCPKMLPCPLPPCTRRGQLLNLVNFLQSVRTSWKAILNCANCGWQLCDNCVPTSTRLLCKSFHHETLLIHNFLLKPRPNFRQQESIGLVGVRIVWRIK